LTSILFLDLKQTCKWNSQKLKKNVKILNKITVIVISILFIKWVLEVRVFII